MATGTMTRTQRVYAMIQLLEQRHYEVAELAGLYGVTVRTIQRDLVEVETWPYYKNVRRGLVKIEPVEGRR